MRTRTYCGLVVSVASLSALIFVPAASADDEPPPTARELLEKCDNGTESCVFHPEGPQQFYLDAKHTVGDPVFNCTSGQQRSSVFWEDITGQSNSVGIAMTTEAGFGKVFAVSYEQTYRHTWEQLHIQRQETFVDTNPHQVGWVERAPQMQKVKGTYELRFPDKFHDHYIWYVPMEVTGPAPAHADAVSQHSRDMTQEEIARCP